MKRRERQLLFGFAAKRKRAKGAGRKPKDPVRGAGVSHLRRPAVVKRFPLHVIVRMRGEVYSLRSGRCFRVLKRAFAAARAQFGMRLCHFSVMGNHIHFLVEAEDSAALARGMKGLGVRMAKALNRVMRRKGAVYADRYFADILRTPTQVAYALNYVRTNAEKHKLIRRGLDPYSSWAVGEVTAPAESWMLSVGWKRAGERMRAGP
ncbi:MAG TPA: transposase [Polyangia bacterium]|nr:transposase [Polyangia bacterium]